MVPVRSSAAIFAIVALYAPPQPSRTFVTVQQKDKGRSLASIASVDISGDGRFVAFESYARLVPADTDNQRDIYVLDRAAGRVTLESGMFPGQTEASHGRLSADARYLVFEAEVLSAVDQLRVDIVVLDRSAGTIRVVQAPGGVPPNGSSHGPEISDDGGTIVFSSVATNLVESGDANGPLEDVYGMDVASGIVKRISVDSDGKQPLLGFSFAPTINADGRIIAFASSAPFTNAGTRESVHASDAKRFGLRQIYVRDERQSTTTQVSLSEDGGWPDGASVRPSISGDGRFVTFSSEATRLVKDDGNRASSDIFVHDRQTRTTKMVTRAPDGRPANGRSIAPAISSDGRFIAFQSDASNLACAKRCPADDEDVNLLWDVFVWDRDEDRITRVSEDSLGGWIEPSIGPALDAHGTVVAFTSKHATDPGDVEGDFDLFVRELPDPYTTLVRQRGR
jgi:Tol biopolymer transport system component